MMKLKKLLIALALIGIQMIGLQAQEAIPAGGGNASGGGGTVSYTVGQVIYTTTAGSAGTITQGVQQPYEITVITALEEAGDITLDLVLYPNPTAGFIRLEINGYKTDNILYQLFNVDGKLLFQQTIKQEETEISMHNYAPATYYLKVIADQREIKTFKIIKY